MGGWVISMVGGYKQQPAWNPEPLAASQNGLPFPTENPFSHVCLSGLLGCSTCRAPHHPTLVAEVPVHKAKSRDRTQTPDIWPNEGGPGEPVARLQHGRDTLRMPHIPDEGVSGHVPSR